MPVVWSRVVDHEMLGLSWSTRPFLGRRSFTSCTLPQSWGGCLWFGQVIQAPPRSAVVMDAAALQHQQPSLWPHPCQSWHQCWCRGRLPDVLCEFLGAGLVPRPVRLNEAQCVTCTIYYYYLLVYHYYILLLDLLLLITVCCYAVITSLLRIITSFIITYYYNFCYHTVITSLLHIITSFIITYHYIFCYYTVITSLLHIITYSFLPNTIGILPR